jgi:hypothetical protein
MTVIVEDYTRDGRREFESRDAAQEWLRTTREVTVFSPPSEGVIECWNLNSNRLVARILPTEVPQ